MNIKSQTMNSPGGELVGKVVLISGAGSGIGRAMALLFAKHGGRVVAMDRTADTVEEVVATIREAGGDASAAVADVTDEQAVERTVADAVRLWGGIDVLCNNAGVMDRMETATGTSIEQWRRIIDINLTGQFLVARAVLPTMIGRSGGSIINTASEAGLRGGAAGVSYTASKHGVVGLTRSLAWTYADQGIRCNAVCPGATATNILEGGRDTLDPEGLALALPVLSLNKRVLAPGSLASVALFLASDASAAISGAILPVDAGWSVG